MRTSNSGKPHYCFIRSFLDSRLCCSCGMLSGRSRNSGSKASTRPEGHSTSYCAVFRYPSELFVDRMHGEQNRAAYAEAFSYPIERIRCARLAGVRRLVGEAKGDR